MGYYCYSKFDFTSALKYFIKSDNKAKSAECLYNHESPSVLSLPFSLKHSTNFEAVREHYESLNGLEQIDDRLL